METDGGYKGDISVRNKHEIMNAADSKAKSDARSRQENVHGDIKVFGCLESAGPWRHDRHLHKYAFASAAVLTQLAYNRDPYRPRQIIY